jgi:hypothetical protein
MPRSAKVGLTIGVMLTLSLAGLLSGGLCRIERCLPLGPGRALLSRAGTANYYGPKFTLADGELPCPLLRLTVADCIAVALPCTANGSVSANWLPNGIDTAL